jgi:hypothetical protein
MDIKVFPNSGHQTVFFPLGADWGDMLPDQAAKVFPDLKLADIAKTLGDSVLKAIAAKCWDNHSPWKECPGKPWIRYRFGTQKRASREYGDRNLHGVWLSVETNLGDATRGYVVREEPATQKDRDDFQQAGQVSETLHAAPDVTRIPEREIVDLAHLLLDEGMSLPSRLKYDEDLSHTILWARPAGAPIDVDLIVDFGNTRTVALALENRGDANGKLRAICMPIHFSERQAVTDAGERSRDAIVDSWIALHEPHHAVCESRRESMDAKEYVQKKFDRRKGPLGIFGKEHVTELGSVRYHHPQMFVEFSPAILGGEAEYVLREKIDPSHGIKAFQSSPKRYAWDTDQGGSLGDVYWSMVHNSWNQPVSRDVRVPPLAGEILRFMPVNGRDWKLDDPPIGWPVQDAPSPTPENPFHPRCDTLTWAALSIIEQAHREITSEPWRRNNSPHIPRRLRKVVVTFPSGWTRAELEAYHAKWLKAISIFRHAHCASPLEEGPTLVMDLDEAIASQLPVIYSEITNLGSIGENYIELVGRKTEETCKARVMTIDVGGGTSDVSVVDYRDMSPGAGVQLGVALLFKDSSTQAGDAVVKSVIEKVLLPTIGAPIANDEDRWGKLRTLFSAALRNAKEKAEWSKITRLVFVPIVRRWLQDRVMGLEGNPEKKRGWTPREIGVQAPEADLLNNKLAVLNTAGELFKLNEPMAPVPNYGAIDDCIELCFGGLFQSLAKHCVSFGCDLVIVAGKPSELPKVKEMLRYHLPIPFERIIFAHDFVAGDWYPLYDHRKIEDAKTVTAVGAALYTAILNGRIPGWDIRLGQSDSETADRQGQFARNYWGALQRGGIGMSLTEFADTYLAPDNDEAEIAVLINTVIGRKRFRTGGTPEPIYVLRWANKDWRTGDAGTAAGSVRIRLQRVPIEGAGGCDSLRLAGVEGKFNGKTLKLEDVELKLCTLADGEFWMETGRFDVPSATGN